MGNEQRIDDPRFWRGEQAESVDSEPWCRSGKFTAQVDSVYFLPPLNPDGLRDERGVAKTIAEVAGRWSQIRVYVDCQAGMLGNDDNPALLLTLWGKADAVPTILAQAPLNACNLEAYQTANADGGRVRGIALAASGQAGLSFFVTARTGRNYVGTSDSPMMRISCQVWGTEGDMGMAQGALGASLAAGGYRDTTVPAQGAMMMGWNAVAGVWLPIAVDDEGRLVVAP